MAAGYNNGEMKVWDVKRKDIEYRSSKKCIEVPCLSWNSTNSLLAFGTSVGEIEVVDFKQRTAVASYARKNYDGIKALKFSPSMKNVLCSGCKDGSIGVYTINQPDLVSRYWKLHTNKVTGIAFTPSQEDLVISCGLDEKISFLDIRQKKIANSIDMSVALTCLSVAPNGYNIVVGSYFGDIKVVDMRKNEALPIKYKGHKSMVKSVEYSKVIKQNKRENSISTITNVNSRNDIPSRLSDNSILHESVNKTMTDYRPGATPIKLRNNTKAEPKPIFENVSPESKFLSDNARPEANRQPGMDKRIENMMKARATDVLTALAESDKDEIKNFIRSEINALRLDMIREFELQRHEFRMVMDEVRNAKK